ncbi:MAG: thymidylate synthase [Culicoidibacterales bacterium]
MQQYLNLMQHVINTGIDVPERTGVGMISVTGAYARWDLSEGFPAMTTKQLAWKAVVAELLWFLSGSSDRRELQILQHGNFDDNRFDIWKGNCIDVAAKKPSRFNGYNVGEMYSTRWRALDAFPHDFIEFSPVQDTDEYQLPDIKPTVYGVGIRTGETDISSGINHRIYRLWKRMIERCYGDNPKYAKNKGTVFVAPRWQVFEEFHKDIFCVKGFHKWVDGEYELDKDYYNPWLYSRNTCVFLSKSFNSSLAAGGGSKTAKCYKIEGKTYCNLNSIAVAYNKSTTTVLPYLKKQNINVEVLETTTKEKLIRPKIYIDQIQKLVDDIEELKINPHASCGRRLIIDAWNPEHESNAVLAICHPMAEFFVRGNKLSCSFTMRSSDVFLGLPFNIASYALLTHIIASVTGLEVGDLTYLGGDVHIYKNAIEQANIQIGRIPMTLPTLKIPKITGDLKDLKVSDFVLENYNPMPAIKAEMAV